MNSKRSMQLRYLTLSTLLCWLMGMPVHAATEAGRILFARGTVSIVDDSEAARGAGTGSVFYEGDRVVTGSKSIVQLRLSDGALTALRSNSDYQIQRQRFDEQEGIHEQAGRLLSGWMRSVTGTIGARHPGNVSQGTSVATIGIRGTTYQIIHVPEQGLAEFPNLQPGTYVYLEDGQVEVSNEAGSRVVSPGQVVRIAGRNVAPELTPELVGLFQSPLLVSASVDSDDFKIRNLLDDETDQIVDQGAGSSLPAFSGNPSVLFANSPFFPTSPLVIEASGTDVIGVAGAGNNKYLTELFLDGGDTNLKAIEGRSPSGSGSTGVYGGGELVSQAHWGHWLVDDHTEYEDTPSNPWHYIIADNAIDPMDFNSIGLVGKYRYNFTGGSELTQVAGSGAAPLTLQNSSNIVVDFSNAMALDVELNFSDSNANNIAMMCVGGCAIGEFYAGELQLDNSSQQSSSYFIGSMQGAFLGAEAEGIMSLISITDETDSINTIDYMGAAVFQREGQALPPPIFGGVSTFDTPDGAIIGPVVFQTLEAEQSGADWYPTRLSIYDSVPDEYVLTSNTTTPLQSGSHTLGSTGETVYWGIWDLYTAELQGSSGPLTTSSDWHYMIAEMPMTESMVTALGLTGQATYAAVANAGTAGIGANSTVTVNFADLAANNAIDVSLDIVGSTTTGLGSLSDLYSASGIGLTNTDPVFSGGSLSGTFAGSNAEALLAGVEYVYNGDQFLGTALFEKSLPVPP